MRRRSIGLPELLGYVRPGARVYIPGATAELDLLRSAFADNPDCLADVELVSCLLPGVNDFDYAALHQRARLTTFLLPPALRPSFETGRVRLAPLCYSAIAEHLARQPADVAILNVTPPENGRVSLGICADFGAIAARAARVRIAVINSALPRPKRSETLPLDLFDAVLEAHEPPRVVAASKPAPELAAIAARIAAFVPNGAAVQTGIGSAPAAIWAALAGKQDLRLRSGMVTDGFVDALETGALAEKGHLAGVAIGSSVLFNRLHDSDLVQFADARQTHGGGLAGIANFIAINSALEVDLLGQANLEWLGDRIVSGVGGAPDFARAAQSSPGGRAILALPSTARAGTVSRIVPKLRCPAVSLSRDLADTVVTEHGTAELRDLSIDARAEALIGIAAPDHRDALATEWRSLRATL